MAEELRVWLYGTPVAVLSAEPRYRISLRWSPAGLERWGRGSRILSVSLPLGTALSARDDRGLDFFENLLPEGPALEAMARVAGVSRSDTFGILTAFGQDCAGAIMVMPEDEPPPDPAAARYTVMTDADLAAAIRNLGSLPLGLDPQRTFRPSLAGFQRKLLAGRDPAGNWLRPTGGAPSTWILKPDGAVPMAANELTCLRLAATCGLPVPETEFIAIDGVPVLAISRYDRNLTDAGPARLHQEDGCQATGVPPLQKYQDAGGPSLRMLARVIQDFGQPAELTGLLARVTFNVAIGNADAHAKNFSFLHHPDEPVVRLAPVYDVVSTLALPAARDTDPPILADTTMGQRIAGTRDIREVCMADLIAEAGSWGIRKAAATQAVHEMTQRISAAVRDVGGDEQVLAVIGSRVAALTAS